MRTKRMTALLVVALSAAVFSAGAVVAQGVSRFSDVPADHGAYDAIEWAYTNQITAGYGEDDSGRVIFKPDEPLRRAHARVFVERLYDHILGAAGDDNFSSPDFTRADMMRVLKAINDGAALQPQPTTPPTTTTVAPSASTVPSPDGRTATGRCAAIIGMGTYAWEWCAWAGVADPEMTKPGMERLIRQVWDEMNAPGKPSTSPTLREGVCSEGDIGHYDPGSHTITLCSGGFTRSTLLHELAHALVAGHASFSDCSREFSFDQNPCYHTEMFRCSADALYTRYGQTPSAGVCGAPPNVDHGDWLYQEPSETAWGIIHAVTVIPEEDYILNGYDGYILYVRCDTDLESGTGKSLTVFLSSSYTFEEGDVFEIRSRFSGGGAGFTAGWSASSGSLWYDGNAAFFLDKFRGSDTLYMSVRYEGGADQIAFDIGDSPILDVVREACRG